MPQPLTHHFSSAFASTQFHRVRLHKVWRGFVTAGSTKTVTNAVSPERLRAD
jgi:hypothetical protein